MKEHVLLWKAIHALEIDLPVLSYEILGGGAIRLNLYGGRVVEYTVPRAAVGAAKPRGSKAGRAGRISTSAGIEAP